MQFNEVFVANGLFNLYLNLGDNSLRAEKNNVSKVFPPDVDIKTLIADYKDDIEYITERFADASVHQVGQLLKFWNFTINMIENGQIYVRGNIANETKRTYMYTSDTQLTTIRCDPYNDT